MKVAFAILSQLCASTCTALGYAIQKSSHEVARIQGTSCICQFRWWLGLLIMQIGTPFSLLALYWADQSLLCTLAPFSIILSLILGKYMLKEELHLNHYVSVSLMIVGSMIAMYFTSKASHHYNLEELENRVLSPLSISILAVNFCLFFIFMTSSFVIIRDITRLSKYFNENELQNCLLILSPASISREYDQTLFGQNKQEEEFDNHYDTSIKTGLLASEINRFKIYTKDNSKVYFHDQKWLKIALFTFPWFTGFLGGLLTLVVKCVVMLLSRYEENDMFTSMFTCCLIFAVPCIAATSLFTLNVGFKYFDSLYIVPLYKASLVFHNTMCGGVLLQEFFIYPTEDLCMYGVGIITIIVGILALLTLNTKSDVSVSRDVNETELKAS